MKLSVLATLTSLLGLATVNSQQFSLVPVVPYAYTNQQYSTGFALLQNYAIPNQVWPGYYQNNYGCGNCNQQYYQNYYGCGSCNLGYYPNNCGCGSYNQGYDPGYSDYYQGYYPSYPNYHEYHGSPWSKRRGRHGRNRRQHRYRIRTTRAAPSTDADATTLFNPTMWQESTWPTTTDAPTTLFSPTTWHRSNWEPRATTVRWYYNTDNSRYY